METLLATVLIQARPVPGTEWSCLCTLWQWGFWIGFVVGIAGAVFLLVGKSRQGA